MGATFSRIKTWIAEVLTPGDLNAEFDNILNNLTPSGVDDYSANTAQMQSTADPYPGSVESLATSSAGELERLRYVIKQITGEAQWYIDPDTDLATHYAATAVHGATGAVVGTTNTQTLTNKTLTTPVLSTPTIADFTNANHTHAGASSGGLLTYSGLPAGTMVNRTHYQLISMLTGSTSMHYDDTIPQNDEGDQYMSLAITPKATTHRLLIEGVLNWSCANGGTFTAALFQDSTANAIAAWEATSEASTTVPKQIYFRHEMEAGTVVSTAFKLRAGLDGATTTTINGSAGARKLGGVMASSMTITEVKA